MEVSRWWQKLLVLVQSLEGGGDDGVIEGIPMQQQAEALKQDVQELPDPASAFHVCAGRRKSVEETVVIQGQGSENFNFLVLASSWVRPRRLPGLVLAESNGRRVTTAGIKPTRPLLLRVHLSIRIVIDIDTVILFTLLITVSTGTSSIDLHMTVENMITIKYIYVNVFRI